MHDDEPRHGESFFPLEDMVNASELREFLFCERAWFLNARGCRVSAKAELHRAAGITFHKGRAAAAQRGASRWPLRWAIILATTGIVILILQFWGGGI
jgi:hypothetical protein